MINITIEQEIQFELVNNEYVELRINKRYFNNSWFVYFGEIQEKLLKLNKTKIVVNMEKCVFISPTPFIALLLTLKECKLSNLCNIVFLLPKNYTKESAGFWAYCRENGFYQIIKDLNSCNMNDFCVGKDEWIEFTNYEKLINVQIIDLGLMHGSIENIVSEIIGEINVEKLQLKNENKNYLMVVLRNILTELLDNVDKHAYKEMAQHKLCALFIRKRNCNEKTIHAGKINNQYHLSETVKPTETYWHNAVEIYFQDLGQGMVSSLKEKGVLKESKRPLREAVQKAFYPSKRNFRVNNTAVTGLQFLGELMADRNDFISVYDEYEGVGTFTTERFQSKRRKLNTNKVCVHDMRIVQYPLKGLIYNFTLFSRESLEYIKYYDKEEIWDIYSKKYEDLQFDIKNYRDTCNVKKSGNIIDKNWLWIIPNKCNTKSMIVEYLKEVLENSLKRRVVIADIEDNELILFQYTLKDTLVNVINSSAFLEEVYLISKKLSFIKLKKDERNILRIVEDEDFLSFNKRFDYLYKLKVYESKLLATIIEGALLKDYVITKGIIEWSPDSELRGYINFDFLVSNSETNSILERNLMRILPYISDCHIYPIDLLTKRLVDTVNIEVEKAQKERNGFIGIGSVIVSGLTLQSNNLENNLNIHFFSRAKGKRRAALFFDPIYLYTEDEEQRRYVRNGKSYRIRPKDLAFQKINTNSYISEKDMYKMLHQFAYSSVLFGHLNIEGRHDLFNINLNAFVYDRDTKLVEFINGMIYTALKHYTKDVRDGVDNNAFFKELEYSSMIVYPYNMMTSSILKQCEQVEAFKEYIWGLVPVNIIYSGETLEYSDTYKKCLLDIIKKFKDKYGNSKPLKIIIFDTLTYTGRTKENIQRFLRSLENIDVKFVNIIDAKISHYDKPKEELNYININIPLLGNKATCEICTVLDKLIIFKETLIDAKLVYKIDEILRDWQVQDVRNFQNSLLLPDFAKIKAIDFMKRNSRYYVDSNIEFKNIIPLYLYLTNRIKLENDFSIIEDILEKYKNIIDSLSLAFMCAIFVMEYGDKVYLSILTSVCNKMLETIFISNNGNENRINHLCLLAILSVDEDIIWRIIKNYLHELNERRQLLSASQEGQILLIYYISKIQSDNVLGKEEFFYMLRNKCKSGNGRLDLYKQFNCQLINTNGNVHNSPLKCIVDNKITDKQLILSSIELIKQSITSYDLKFDILYEDREGGEDPIEGTDLLNACIKHINELESKIEKTSFDYDSESCIIHELYDRLLKIHSKLFAPYFINIKPEDRDKDNIIEKVNALIEEHNINHQGEKVIFSYEYDELILPHKDISAIYYIWNNMLAREIYYILDNVAKYTENDKKVFIEGEEVSGQVCIKIEEMDFFVRVYNNSNHSIENIERALKQRYQKEVLDMLGVEIKYKKNVKESNIFNGIFDENAIVAVIKIPNIYKIGGKRDEKIFGN